MAFDAGFARSYDPSTRGLGTIRSEANGCLLSINHLGYCMLGLFAATAPAVRPLPEMQAALSGVFMQIFNHGITAAALFYFVGLLEQRRGSRGSTISAA